MNEITLDSKIHELDLSTRAVNVLCLKFGSDVTVADIIEAGVDIRNLHNIGIDTYDEIKYTIYKHGFNLKGDVVNQHEYEIFINRNKDVLAKKIAQIAKDVSISTEGLEWFAKNNPDIPMYQEVLNVRLNISNVPIPKSQIDPMAKIKVDYLKSKGQSVLSQEDIDLMIPQFPQSGRCALQK